MRFCRKKFDNAYDRCWVSIPKSNRTFKNGMDNPDIKEDILNLYRYKCTGKCTKLFGLLLEEARSFDMSSDLENRGRMNVEQYKFLKMLTFGTYNELFEVIDADGIRKPAIRTKIRDVEPSPNREKNFNKEFWTVEIDWRLIDRWKPFREENEAQSNYKHL